MNFSPYFGVFWKSENKYSCVTRHSIADGKLRKESDLKLLSLEELEVSFNRRIYPGRLVFAGASTRAVTEYLDSIPSDDGESDLSQKIPAVPGKGAKPSSKRKRSEDIGNEIDKILGLAKATDKILSPTTENFDLIQQENMQAIGRIELAEIDPTDAVVCPDRKIRKLEKKLKKKQRSIEKLEEDLAEERALREKYKSKSKNLQRKIQKFQAEKTTTEDIGNGVKINTALLDRARIFSSTPAILARNVFRLVFQETDVKGKSLFGRLCNANKHSFPKPSVDSLKRDSVINYCLKDLEEESKSSGAKFDKGTARAKITKSLGEYVREVNYKGANCVEEDINSE